MITGTPLSVTPSEEKPEYKFDFCKDCSFYECELIGEYEQYRKNHCKVHPEREQPNSEDIIYVPAVPAENDDASVVAFSGVIDDGISDMTGKIEVYAEAFATTDDERAESLTAVNSSGSAPKGDFLSYDCTQAEHGCMMSKRHVIQIECGRKRVSDGIGNHFKIDTDCDFNIERNTIERWEPAQPIFISAQTGQGKNFFIEKTLIPYVKELNCQRHTKQKVLILSNRLALQHQIRNRIDERNTDEDGLDELRSYAKYADVITYQGFLHQIEYMKQVQKDKRANSRYICVICDEAHFFTSDAMFNPHTHKILENIVSVFKDAIRVYMSATPYECLEYILKCERATDQYATMAFYHFERDYSYLDVNTYSEIKELYDIIAQSVKKSEKWLIFIDNKDEGKKVKEELEKRGIEGKNKILAVNATSKSDPVYREVVSQECLPEKTNVLITTSVLDNGVNLNNINHVVISDMSKVKCLQMVGRARVSGNGDWKTLYVKRFDNKYVEKRLDDYRKQKDAYHSYNLAYAALDNPFVRRGNSEYLFLSKYYDGSNGDWVNAKHWFGRDEKNPKELYVNEIAQSLVEKLITNYKFISEEMASELKRQGGEGQKYLEYQLSWFGAKYVPERDITLIGSSVEEKKFIDFLKSYAEFKIKIAQEQQLEFSKEFIRLHDAAFGKSDINSRNYGQRKMNSILEKRNIDYKVDKEDSCWIVIDFNRSPNISTAE